MQEEILMLAKTLSGAGEDEAEALALLCAASEKAWTQRLQDGMTAEKCREAFLCAAALNAAAGLIAGRGGAVRFTAGDVSVTETEGGQTAGALREEAERLMAPYVTAADFCFRGVRG
ncbi:hypothetical protein SDC9_175788 [bioreactor metagenome]|uniref:Uncharacterized protein n=1 Tax=bioreactor metagenome TaxID=1076179 RepID=A0A645GNB2_9ZZZZ|nr:hypothetical protein [Oscillibacter sp.]